MLDENALCRADQTLAEFIVELADAVLQDRKPLFLDRDVDGVTQVRRRRAGPRAVDERVRAIETRLGDQIQGLHEIVVRFRSEEHTSELQSLMRISYDVFCL